MSEIPWLGPCASTAEGLGSIPDLGTKIPQAAWHDQKRKGKEKQMSNDFLFSYQIEMGLE